MIFLTRMSFARVFSLVISIAIAVPAAGYKDACQTDADCLEKEACYFPRNSDKIRVNRCVCAAGFERGGCVKANNWCESQSDCNLSEQCCVHKGCDGRDEKRCIWRGAGSCDLVGGIPVDESPAAPKTSLKAAIQDKYDRIFMDYNSKDIDAFMRHYKDNGVFISPAGEAYVGFDKIKEFARTTMSDNSTITVNVNDAFLMGTNTVLARFAATWTEQIKENEQDQDIDLSEGVAMLEKNGDDYLINLVTFVSYNATEAK